MANGEYNYEYNNNFYNPRDRGARDRTIRFLLQGAEAAAVIQQRRQQQQPPEQPPLRHEGEGAFYFAEQQRRRSSSYFIGIFPLLGKILFNGLLGCLLLLVSLGEFGIFYKLAMPRLHSSEVLHFDYTGGTGRNHWCSPGAEEDSSCSQRCLDRYGNYRHSIDRAPIAVVDLFSTHVSWQHHHPGVVPPVQKESRVLTLGAPHYIEILLDLPESNLNRETIGMFSVLVDLHSRAPPPPPFQESENDDDNDEDDDGGARNCTNGETTTTTTVATTNSLLASSIRTARIPHESFWISVVRKFVCLVPHMLGAIPESRRVVVPSFRFFVETEDLPLRYVTVRLVMSPEQANRGEIVEVVGGSVHIGQELQGLPKILKEWFFVCLTVGTTLLFFLQVVSIWILQSIWEYKSQRQQQEEPFFHDDDNVSEGLDLDGLEDTEEDPNDPGADETTIPRAHNSSYDIDGETGQWEDLPTPTTPPAASNQEESLAGGFEPTDETTTRHTIPEESD